ncbi:bacterial transcriptional activator domain-containing protein [Nocardia sp. NPDC006630]|uniref:tetratricopeptide repeat protein n=1 Tax=Nocardia sp. NPDC006630 TaxID=3157181 RepID=UPI0033A3BDBF
MADLGNRLLSGSPFPAYQSITPGPLRALISLDAPHVPYLEDPRRLPPQHRSEPWRLLCDQVDAWSTLPSAQQLRVAQVLAKLGFWELVLALTPADPAPVGGAKARALAFLHAAALFRLDPRDPAGSARMRELAIAKASDQELTPAARLSAALNVAVHHARASGEIGAAKRWQAIAESLASSAPPNSLSLLLRSAYWRGLGLIRFVEGDHGEVARMMDRSEDLARWAMGAADGFEPIAALENMNAVLETRARACWSAGDLDSAERYFRRHTDHDPWDAKAHVRLADFLFRTGRIDEAREGYRRAAVLGAPYTVYARTRLAR